MAFRQYLSTVTAAAGDPATARTVGLGIGAARTAIGLAFLAAPARSVRALGVDAATANRLTWLGRMTAGRDAAVGVGTLLTAGTPVGAGWLIAGAACDTVDAVVLTTALRQGRLRGALTWAVTVGAAGAVVLAGIAAVGAARE